MKCGGTNKVRAALRSYQIVSHDTQWKQIPGFPAYEASSCGNIRRRHASNFGIRVLKPMPGSRGYLKVTLYDERGRKTSVPVHRAVCLAWHGLPRPERNLACHDNGVKTDNRSENLYWGTPSDNTQDCLRHGTHSSKNRGRFVQTSYSRDTPRKIRIAMKEGIISHKQGYDELDKLNSR